jgi:hypothetical protein
MILIFKIFITCHLFKAKPYGVTVTLSLPPDTDTPGFAEEQKSKPEETRLISESAGLFSAEKVAKQTLDDALVFIIKLSWKF